MRQTDRNGDDQIGALSEGRIHLYLTAMFFQDDLTGDGYADLPVRQSQTTALPHRFCGKSVPESSAAGGWDPIRIFSSGMTATITVRKYQFD